MPKVVRAATPLTLVALETIAVLERSRPFVVGLLGTSGRVSFAAATAEEAEGYAVEQMGADARLFGAVVRCEGERLVSRVLPG